MKQPCVYILATARNGTLYTGVTSDLVKRGWEHKKDLAEGFTKRYAQMTKHEGVPKVSASESVG